MDIDRRIEALLAVIEAERANREAELEAERANRKAEIEAERASREAEIEAERANRKAEIEAERASREAELDKIGKLLNDSIAEARERQIEVDRRQIEADKRQEEADKRQAENQKQIIEIRQEMGGITKSNGEFAEEYFENVYCRDMTFAGMRFHEMIRRKRFENHERKDEFDIIMLNEKNTVIVETKYKARESDVDSVIKKAAAFRHWYPDYKDHKIYLCLACLRFEENIIGRARKKGIAIIRQLGDKTEVNDTNLKAY